MALSQNSLCDWDDIVTLFTNLNTQRQRFGYSKLTTPSNTGVVMQPATVTTLVNGISDLRNNSFVGSTANVTDITVPQKGSLVKPLPFTQIQTKITNLSNVRIFSSFFSNNFGDFQDEHFFGTFFSGDFGDSHFFGTFFSGDFGSSNFGARHNFGAFFSRHFNTFFSSFPSFSSCNSGVRPSFTSFNSGHNGSNDGDFNRNDDFVSTIF